MIVLEPGFKCVTKIWKEYVNMPQSEVEEILKKELPNVEFKVFEEEEFKYCSEEFYFLRIAIVVDKNGIVVCPPKFFGTEPDFEKIANAVGKIYQTVCCEIKKDIPSVKVIVTGKDGQQKWSNKDEIDHYILVKVDDDDKVSEALSYVRVSK